MYCQSTSLCLVCFNATDCNCFSLLVVINKLTLLLEAQAQYAM